ncbi:unnamed protein product [Discula destructiva]
MFLPLSGLAFATFLLRLSTALSVSDIPSDTPISSLLQQATQFLATGKTADALVYYDAAVARDPDDYLTYFKRATTYLSLGRTSQAASDFDKCLALRPGFEGAHLQLGKLKAKQADWNGAREQYTLAKLEQTSADMAELIEAQGAAKLAEDARRSGRWDECINQAGVAIMIANRAVSLRELRSSCRFNKGEVEEGMGDLHHILNLRPGDTDPHVQISAITFFALGDTQQGMAQIRKCLHSDPDSKVCKKLLKQEKAIDKTIAKVEKAFGKNQPMTGTKLLISTEADAGLIKEVTDQIADLKKDKYIPEATPSHLLAKLVELACQGYYESNGKKAADYCKEALDLNENSFYGLLHRAKVLSDAEEYEPAVNQLNKAKEAAPDKGNIVDPLLREAQINLKRSKNRDYYKVLGVSRDADEKQIKSAYRKLVQKNHPDRAQRNGATKEEAEKKMQQINEAYEVLSDPELRARFDHGDDPNSQERGGSPFQQGGFPGGGGGPFMFQQGGQQFHFKFGGQGGGSPFGF